MSRRRQVEDHRRRLQEIRDIMNSMKNLSYMENRKLGRFLHVQHAVVSNMETVARDFLSYWPAMLSSAKTGAPEVYVLVGSERGFCGDFNHTLLRHFEALLKSRGDGPQRIIAIGHKLHMLIQEQAGDMTFIEGASVVDEVDEVLNQLVQQLADVQQQYQALNLYALYFADRHQPVTQQLLPPFLSPVKEPVKYSHPPQLNLQRGEFLLQLGYHYLFAVLHEILYTSLMTENRRRVAHLEAAVQHLDEQALQLRHQSNVLRQEEIIEEIEVILLNTTSVDLT